MINNHKNYIFVSEIIFKIKKKLFLYMYFIFFGGGTFWEFP